MRRATVATLLLVVSVLTVALGARSAEPGGFEELLAYYRARDYFALRERLGGVPDVPPEGAVEVRFLAAAVQHAFNRPAASNATLLTLGVGEGLPRELAGEARRLRMANHLRLHQYDSALSVARQIIDAASDHPAELVSEVRNVALLLEALRDVPPQMVENRKTSLLKQRLDGSVTVEIEGERLELGLDTGANFSVLMQSEARRVGLSIRAVGLQVATSTGRPVLADLAVADSVGLGAARFRNVVFLVFPDQQLTFPDGSRIRGLVGFPMLEALGEIRFLKGGALEIPGWVQSRKRSNLALDDHEPLVRARIFDQDLICRLDTGAERTFFYAPFYRRFKQRIESLGSEQTVEVGGVGGVHDVNVYRLPSLSINVARADVKLRKVDVYTSPLVANAVEYLDCNLGVDAFEPFRYYAINFRDMALVLG